MTRNKNRKESIRKRAEAEGVGVARATMLHDRERNLSTEITDALKREDRLSWTLGWQGKGNSNALSHPKLTVPFNTDSSSAFKATPHFLIEKGTHKQRFHLMDRIGREVKRTGAADAYIVDSDDHSRITSLAIQHEMRKMVMKSAGVNTFDELRRYFIKEESVPLRSTPKYEFLFIYDYEFAMLGASRETLDDLKFILENGHESGIHVIISSDNLTEDVWGMTDKLRTVSFHDAPDSPGVEDGLSSVIYKGSWTYIDSGYPFDDFKVSDDGPGFALVDLLDWDGLGLGAIKLTKTETGGLLITVEDATSKRNSVHMGDVDRITRVMEHEIESITQKELGLNIRLSTEGMRLVTQDHIEVFGPQPKPRDIPIR